MTDRADAVLIAAGAFEATLGVLGAVQAVRLRRARTDSDRMRPQLAFTYVFSCGVFLKGVLGAVFQTPPPCAAARGTSYGLQRLPSVAGSFAFLVVFALLAAFTAKLARVLRKAAAASDGTGRRRHSPHGDRAAAATALVVMLIAICFLAMVVMLFSTVDGKQCFLASVSVVIASLLVAALVLLLSVFSFQVLRVMYRAQLASSVARGALVCLYSLLLLLLAARSALGLVVVFGFKDPDLHVVGTKGAISYAISDANPQVCAFCITLPVYKKSFGRGAQGSVQQEAQQMRNPLISESSTRPCNVSSGAAHDGEEEEMYYPVPSPASYQQIPR